MVKFTLDNVEYQTPSSWHEVEFGKFLDYLSEVTPLTPEALIEVMNSEDLSTTWSALTKKNRKKCYDFFALSVGFWCDIDAKKIKSSMNLVQLENAFWTIQIDLSLDNLTFDEEFTGFEIGKKEYLLPKKHMEGSTVVEFAEAAQFQEKQEDLENGQWLAMLDVMVVLCRPKGEVYEYIEQRHNVRKKQFRKLKMDIVANVSFFLLKLNSILKTNLLIYGLGQELSAKEQRKYQKTMDGI
ncbi:MAG: hypothetical protein ACYSW3_28510 [Planctomycetota bacterium]|jgi:hypothetical protein